MNLRMQQEMRDMAMFSPLYAPVGIRPTYGILQLLDGLIGEVLQLIARHGVCRIVIEWVERVTSVQISSGSISMSSR